mmetsp:Transcript_27116/g.77977  ORF Transcript_27116/g.77977 Transcript_27116/m.77977 type:complete len:99 (+) Transcript_27116:326-622(+)
MTAEALCLSHLPAGHFLLKAYEGACEAFNILDEPSHDDVAALRKLPYRVPEDMSPSTNFICREKDVEKGSKKGRGGAACNLLGACLMCTGAVLQLFFH